MNVRAHNEQPDLKLAAIVAQLQAQLAAKDAQFEAQLAEKDQQLSRKDQALALAEVKIQVLEERLRLSRIARYGSRSETLSDLQLALLDLEPVVSSDEVEAESQREALAPNSAEANPQSEPANKPRRKHPGRQQLPAHLERVDQIVGCTPEQCRCGQCGSQTAVIGYEETEVLDGRPAEYFVRVIKREKRACRACEESAQTAAAPERIVPKSVLSDHVIIEAVVNKYCASLPLYRQQAMIKARCRHRDPAFDARRLCAADGRASDADRCSDEARTAGRKLYPGRRDAGGCPNE